MRVYYSNDQTQYAHDCDYKAELKQDWRSGVHGEKPRLTAILVGSRRSWHKAFLEIPAVILGAIGIQLSSSHSPRCMIQCVPCVFSFY